MNSASTIRFAMRNTIRSKTWMPVFIICGKWMCNNTPPTPRKKEKKYQSVYEVKRFVWKRWAATSHGPSLTFLIAICFLSFILQGRGEQKTLACATIKEREVFVFLLTVACMLCAKLRDQWQRGCYHSTRSRRSWGRRDGREVGGWWGCPWWFILIGAQSFVLKGEGETGCWKQIPPDQLELCNKNTLIFLGTFA